MIFVLKSQNKWQFIFGENKYSCKITNKTWQITTFSKNHGVLTGITNNPGLCGFRDFSILFFSSDLDRIAGPILQSSDSGCITFR